MKAHVLLTRLDGDKVLLSTDGLDAKPKKAGENWDSHFLGQDCSLITAPSYVDLVKESPEEIYKMIYEGQP